MKLLKAPKSTKIKKDENSNGAPRYLLTKLKNKALLARVKKLHSGTKPPRMTPDEKRLVRDMAFQQDMEPTDIADVVGRHVSNICQLLEQKKTPKMGRPLTLSEKQVDTIEKVLENIVPITPSPPWKRNKSTSFEMSFVFCSGFVVVGTFSGGVGRESQRGERGNACHVDASVQNESVRAYGCGSAPGARVSVQELAR